jgi:hypothetical protein
MATYVLHPLFKGKVVRVNDTPPIKPSGFYATLEGDGVCENEVLFGTDVKLTFHIPALPVADHDISFGLSVIPYGPRFPVLCEHEWYKLVRVPCEETEVSFSFIVPTEEEWKKALTPGFVVTLDAEGLPFYSEFLSIRFVRKHFHPKKTYVKKLGIDLEQKIQGITDRVLRWREHLQKTVLPEEKE